MAKKTTGKSATATALIETPTMNALATEQRAKIDQAYQMLLREAMGEPIAPENLPALTILGGVDELAKARQIAKRAAAAMEAIDETKGAADRAEAARKERDTKVPKLREQIARIESEIRELENAPRTHERDAVKHNGAIEALTHALPAHIKSLHLERMRTRENPLRKQWVEKRSELNTLRTWLELDPYNSKGSIHLFKSARDQNGQSPWVITEERGGWRMQIVDAGAWRQFLDDENVEQRIAELAPIVDELKQQADAVEKECKAMVREYWRGLTTK